MRRLGIALLVLLLLTGTATAVDQQFVYANATLGTGSTLISFGFPAKSVLIQNRNTAGGISVYVDFLGLTADAADFELIAGASIQVGSAPMQRGGFGRLSIRSVSATSNVQILAVN